MTAPLFISEPVAGRVRTVPKGRAAFTGALRVTRSQGSSPAKGTAAAMNLVPSMTEPPPTARMNSALVSRATWTAFIRVSKLGFGSMPPNSVTLAWARAARTSSRVPFLTTLPPP